MGAEAWGPVGKSENGGRVATQLEKLPLPPHQEQRNPEGAGSELPIPATSPAAGEGCLQQLGDAQARNEGEKDAAAHALCAPGATSLLKRGRDTEQPAPSTGRDRQQCQAHTGKDTGRDAPRCPQQSTTTPGNTRGRGWSHPAVLSGPLQASLPLARLPSTKLREQRPEFLKGKAIYLKENDVFGK